MDHAIADDDPLLQDAWRRIQRIEDPCHALSDYPLSIGDLGIVNRIEHVGADIEVGLTYTEMGCTFAYRIVARLEDELGTIPGVNAVRVVYEPFPPWHPRRLSERARSVYRERKQRSIHAISDTRVGGLVTIAAAAIGTRTRSEPTRSA
jgi:metal-sulfur cluster biosynthetic enzyme